MMELRLRRKKSIANSSIYIGRSDDQVADSLVKEEVYGTITNRIFFVLLYLIDGESAPTI